MVEQRSARGQPSRGSTGGKRDADSKQAEEARRSRRGIELRSVAGGGNWNTKLKARLCKLVRRRFSDT